ncbi:MAG: LPS export ABC transporter periplasmic protein LptC [Alphaproteobacteria bacterium]
MNENENAEDDFSNGKLDLLISRREPKAARDGAAWTRLVRKMRLILPLAALALFAVVFVWSDMRSNNILPAKELAKAPVIGKNEILNPRFESTDSSGQPFVVSADQAIQNKDDENLIMLEKPLADMTLKSGEKISGNASRGSFRQNNKTLLLRGAVDLAHDKGYHLKTEELDIDLQNNTAFSKVDVTGNGPEGTLTAKGLEGYADKGLLIFNGPAKLVLTNTDGKTGGLLGK